MRKSFVLFMLLLPFSLSVKGQIGVGEWRDHLPFTFPLHVSESPSRIFAASAQGIMVYDKRSNHLHKYTKVNGLSDIGISAMAYSDANDLLLAGYSNGNIDILKGDQVINFSDIKRASVIGSKSINHILFVDELAYLSCGFGIVVLNLEKLEVKETYYIGNLGEQLQVNQLVLDNNYFYAATREGIFMADYSSPNLVDYANWNQVTELPDYTASYNAIYVNQGVVLANKVSETSADITYIYDGQTWSVFNDDYSSIQKIKHGNSQVQLVTPTSIVVYDQELNFVDSVSANDISNLKPNDVLVDNQGTWWIADHGNGLIRYTGGSYENIYLNAPYTPNAYAMDIVNNRVLVTGGGITPSWNNVFINGSVFSFRNEQWQSMMNYEAHDYVSVKIDPYLTDHYFVGTWGKGVIEYSNDQVVNEYNESNSTLQSLIPGENYIRIPGMCWDDDNNLWITNTEVSQPVSVKTAGGEWYSFNFDSEISNMRVQHIMVTRDDHVWVTLPGNGLFVFDDNQTPGNGNDDLYRHISIVDVNGKIISNQVYAFAEDLDGNIWVGTDQGIVVYYNPSNVFESPLFYAQRIVLTIDDYTQYLLNTETITSIAVDGANKKWLGTQNAGVYLVSKDGTQEINHFTEENSPLFSNRINDVAIDHETGEVFMATDKGLISYRGSATMGSDEFRDVYVYPNPVREDYQGDITIRGLVADVSVKITDISGNIVYETVAEGGQATWDGRNFSGRRVSTGVYLVFCSNEDGTKTTITKLLFVR